MTTGDIDPQRIYVVGVSNGGFMTQRLACTPFASRMAAAVSVISTIAEDLVDRCLPPEPTPMLMVASDDDPIIPFDGGPILDGDRGVAASFEALRTMRSELNGCKGLDGSEILDEVDDGTRVRIDRFAGCQTETITMVVEGGGHTWPGGRSTFDFLVGRTSQEMDMARTAWDFVRRQRR